MMDNREAIAIIKTAIAEVEWEYPMDYAAAFDVAVKALENGWISVKDRLPEDESDVLVVKQIKNGKRKIQLARCIPEFEDYETGEKGYWECVGGNKVLFWMPLPKMPKEDT